MLSYGVILDLIVLAIFVICVLVCAKRGFVKTIVAFVGTILAIVVVYTLSGPASEFIYNVGIEPSIVKSAEKSANEKSLDTVNAVYDAFPDFLNDNLEKFGFNRENVTVKISDAASTGIKDAAVSGSRYVVKPIVTRLLASVISLLAIIILIPVVKLLSRLLNKIASVSIVGKINSLLGGIVGLLLGLLIACVFCFIANIIGTFTSVPLFSIEAIESSYSFGFLYDIIPFI